MSTAHCTDLPAVSGGSATRDAGGNPLITQEKHVLSAGGGASAHFALRGENISLPLTTIPGTDRAGRWLGLPGHRTTNHWTSYHGAT